jgi:nitrogen regulatory protein PII
MTHKAKKVVIITEKLILHNVTKILEDAGATGYTVTSAGGKGSRNVRSDDRTKVVDAFSNVKIETILGDAQAAERIAEQVADTYFTNYSGVTYLQDVEILRPHKFTRTS